jgi:hypothetical protein
MMLARDRRCFRVDHLTNEAALAEAGRSSPGTGGPNFDDGIVGIGWGIEPPLTDLSRRGDPR